MSQPSPSLLNSLRRFRFQKKPVNNDDTISNDDFNRKHKIVRKLQSDSSSDDDPHVTKFVAKNECLTSASDEESPQLVPVKHEPEDDAESNAEIISSDTSQNGWTKTENENNSVAHKDEGVTHRDANGDSTEQCRNQKRKHSSPLKTKSKRVRKIHSSDSEEESSFKDKKVFDSDADSDEEITDDLTDAKRKVLDFLSNASEKELRLMPVCSQKRLEAILEQRPFTGWKDLVTKFQNGKFLGTNLLNSAQQVVEAREVVSSLMRKCERIATKTENAISDGRTSISQQPGLLSGDLQLKSYQMVGLNWLAVMYNQGLNGILADEMGLGKTIQVIAFLAHLKETGCSVYNNPHLIVVPSSTLENWWNEFGKWCPKLKVRQYYGSPEERKMLRHEWITNGFEDTDIVLTTYSMVSSCYEERKMFRVIPLHYVVFDEAHMLKNMNTQRYENLFRINAKHRILLTGTPLQNNLLELMSLLVFVMPQIFAGKTDYLKFLFSKNSKTPAEEAPLFEQERVAQAKRIMKPFVLRRLKVDVLHDLPKKTSTIVECDMEESQVFKYAQLVEKFKLSENSDLSHMSIMMDLRKMANHPLTLRYQYDEEKLYEIAERLAKDLLYKENDVNRVLEDLTFMSDFEIHQLSDTYKCLWNFQLPDSLFVLSGKMKKLDEILPLLKQDGHRILIFSQFVFMLDLLEKYMTIRGHTYLRLDGSTPVFERQDLIDLYNQDDSIFAFLLSTKAGGVGINLAAADTVIIHDVDFNPYNDKQAEDRCHRMGQTKPVQILRLVSKGTVEETIMKVAQEKLHLEREVTTYKDGETAESKNVARLLRQVLGFSSEAF